MKKDILFQKSSVHAESASFMTMSLKSWGVLDLSKVVYDCRKLSITKKVLDCLYEFYHSENQSDETITTCMLLYGPKADLDGDGYAVEVEDGFVTKGV